MAIFVVEERFSPAVQTDGLDGWNDRLSPCLRNNQVSWVTSFVKEDGSQCVCVFEAPDAASVERAYKSAEVPFEYKVWPAKHLRP
ncbi:MAG TPA: nickel-binding protein [Kofleriaceae bacterium]|nr:nickel-binding protein [Kofleriaceae bacterium]